MGIWTAPFKSILHLWQEDAFHVLILISVLAELARWRHCAVKRANLEVSVENDVCTCEDYSLLGCDAA
jgi:hypothetical protein